MTETAAKPPACPRCQGRMVPDGTEGDLSCFTCGFVIYIGAVPAPLEGTAWRRQPSHGGHKLD